MNFARLPTIVLTDAVLPGEAAEMANLLLQARARRSDPETSQEAAASVTRMTERREAVLAMFDEYTDYTDFELVFDYLANGESALHPRQSESGIRTRRSELVRMGKLRDSGRTRQNPTGRRCIVWERQP